MTINDFDFNPFTRKLDLLGAGFTNLTQFTQTPWRVFYSNGTGAVIELALGADGTFFQSNGATSIPSFAALVASDIPDLSGTYQILNAKLTSLIGLTYVSTSFVKMTGANTFSLDTATYQPAGTYVTSVTGTAPVVSSNGTTPAISMPAATSSVNGYLTSTDWSTFNGKQPAGTYVTSISIATANGISGSSSGGATPSLTLSLGVITPTSVNGLTFTALATGFSIAGGTASRTLTVDETKSLTNYLLADGTRVLTGNWLTSAGATEVQFRATGNRIYSSAANTLDVLGSSTTNIGVAGDIVLGDGNLRTMYAQTPAKIDLGKVGNEFNKLLLANKITTYNNIATVSGGVPSELATVDLTAQGAAIAATTIYAVPASGLGMYRISWVATVTRIATTSCILGGTNGFQVKYTDGDDSVVKTSNPTTVTVSAINATGTSISGTFNAYCKASTNLQYLFDYTSIGAQTMQYNLHIKVEAL